MRFGPICIPAFEKWIIHGRTNALSDRLQIVKSRKAKGSNWHLNNSTFVVIFWWSWRFLGALRGGVRRNPLSIQCFQRPIGRFPFVNALSQAMTTQVQIAMHLLSRICCQIFACDAELTKWVLSSCAYHILNLFFSFTFDNFRSFIGKEAGGQISATSPQKNRMDYVISQNKLYDQTIFTAWQNQIDYHITPNSFVVQHEWTK